MGKRYKLLTFSALSAPFFAALAWAAESSFEGKFFEVIADFGGVSTGDWWYVPFTAIMLTAIYSGVLFKFFNVVEGQRGFNLSGGSLEKTIAIIVAISLAFITIYKTAIAAFVAGFSIFIGIIIFIGVIIMFFALGGHRTAAALANASAGRLTAKTGALTARQEMEAAQRALQTARLPAPGGPAAPGTPGTPGTGLTGAPIGTGVTGGPAAPGTPGTGLTGAPIGTGVTGGPAAPAPGTTAVARSMEEEGNLLALNEQTLQQMQALINEMAQEGQRVMQLAKNFRDICMQGSELMSQNRLPSIENAATKQMTLIRTRVSDAYMQLEKADARMSQMEKRFESWSRKLKKIEGYEAKIAKQLPAISRLYDRYVQNLAIDTGNIGTNNRRKLINGIGRFNPRDMAAVREEKNAFALKTRLITELETYLKNVSSLQTYMDRLSAKSAKWFEIIRKELKALKPLLNRLRVTEFKLKDINLGIKGVKLKRPSAKVRTEALEKEEIREILRECEAYANSILTLERKIESLEEVQAKLNRCMRALDENALKELEKDELFLEGTRRRRGSGSILR